MTQDTFVNTFINL